MSASLIYVTHTDPLTHTVTRTSLIQSSQVCTADSSQPCKLWHKVYIHEWGYSGMHIWGHSTRKWVKGMQQNTARRFAFKCRSAETKPHQSDSFITLCQVQPPQHHSIWLPTHPLQVNNGPALNIEANLTQNYIRRTNVDLGNGSTTYNYCCRLLWTVPSPDLVPQSTEHVMWLERSVIV